MRQGACTYCQRHRSALTGAGRRFKLCKQCASVKEIVQDKIKAEQVRKEIQNGLPKLYKELREESDNERNGDL